MSMRWLAGEEGRLVPVPVPLRDVEDYLRSTQTFGMADPSLVSHLASLLQCRECVPGTLILQEGSPQGGLALVVEGSGRVLAGVRSPSGPTLLDTLVAGDTLGEASVFLDGPSPYSVVADEHCKLLWMAPEVARGVFQHVPNFADVVAQRLSTQLSRAAVAAAASRPAVADAGFTAAPAALSPGMVPFVEVADFEPPRAMVTAFPQAVMRQHKVFPLRFQGQTVTVGMVAPKNAAALQAVQAVLPAAKLEVVAIAEADFQQALGRFKADEGRTARAKGTAAVVNPETMAFETVVEETRAQGADANVKQVGDDIIKLVNRMLAAGIEKDASDIHVEPTATAVRVRFRVDGELQEWPEQVKSQNARALAVRIKLLAGMDITDRRMPQDGRIALTAQVGNTKREVDIRASSLPTSRGEKLVLRILDPANSQRALDRIFLDPGTLAVVRRQLGRGAGALIVAGATASGKTSTLYAMLNEFRNGNPQANVMTVEDPVEYRLNGVTQVQVNAAIGLTFSHVLRAMLRQDPDLLVVGETRDQDTAENMLTAALTGHSVVTSMHAYDSAGVLERLENLGVRRSVLAQSLGLVLVQRLAHRLCPSCTVVEAPARHVMAALVARNLLDPSVTAVPRATGCDACSRTGHAGRVAVVEALAMTDDLKNSLASGTPVADLVRQARQSGALRPFATCVSYMLAQGLMDFTEALALVAE